MPRDAGGMYDTPLTKAPCGGVVGDSVRPLDLVLHPVLDLMLDPGLDPVLVSKAGVTASTGAWQSTKKRLMATGPRGAANMKPGTVDVTRSAFCKVHNARRISNNACAGKCIMHLD